MLYGELNKWVPMSPKRVTRITVASDDLVVTLTGGAMEIVTFTYAVGGQMYNTDCVMSAAGTATLSVANRRCWYCGEQHQ